MKTTTPDKSAVATASGDFDPSASRRINVALASPAASQRAVRLQSSVRVLVRVGSTIQDRRPRGSVLVEPGGRELEQVLAHREAAVEDLAEKLLAGEHA